MSTADSPIDTDVLVAGAGPAGLMLAGELALAGAEVTLVERDAVRPARCRGFNLNARALDLLACRGLADGLVAEGHQVPTAAATQFGTPLRLAGTATGHPFSLGIPQTRVEEVLEARANDLGVRILRGHDLRSFEQDADSVTIRVHDGNTEKTLRAQYLVGCDGGRSRVRKHAGIAFPGADPTFFLLLGDVECELPYGVSAGVDERTVFVIPRPGYVRVIVREENPPEDRDTPVTLELLQSEVDAVLGRHVELSAPRWLTRFSDAERLAETYRRGRVLLAGDAAHIHPPAMANGVNVALEDAVNLGWKLAATVLGTAPEGLLGTYHDERHAAGKLLLTNSRALVQLPHAPAELTDLVNRVAAHPDGNRALAEILVGLDVSYPTGAAPEHPWLGRFAPDVKLITADGPTTLADTLHSGRPVLLDLSGENATQPYALAARCPDHPELRAVLLRPDGHVAWLATDSSDDGLAEALQRWFSPAPALT